MNSDWLYETGKHTHTVMKIDTEYGTNTKTHTQTNEDRLYEMDNHTDPM